MCRDRETDTHLTSIEHRKFDTFVMKNTIFQWEIGRSISSRRAHRRDHILADFFESRALLCASFFLVSVPPCDKNILIGWQDVLVELTSDRWIMNSLRSIFLIVPSRKWRDERWIWKFWQTNVVSWTLWARCDSRWLGPEPWQSWLVHFVVAAPTKQHKNYAEIHSFYEHFFFYCCEMWMETHVNLNFRSVHFYISNNSAPCDCVECGRGARIYTC